MHPSSSDRILLIFKDGYTAERGLIKLGLRSDDRYRACGYGAALAGSCFQRIIILSRPQPIPSSSEGEIVNFAQRCQDWENQIRCRLVPGGEFIVLA